MSLTPADKVKINKYIRENKMGEIYYQEMCEILGKRGKVSDLEFLEYFTDSVLNEFKKETKISAKYVAKLVQTVDTFLGWINNQYIKVPESTLDKIKSFDSIYQEYSERTNFAIDEELNEEYIKPLMETIKVQLQKVKKSDSVAKYLNQIKELESEIKNLKKELVSIQKQLDRSEKTSQQKQDKIELIGEKLAKVTNESKNKSNEIKTLGLEIKELTSKIERLEGKIRSQSLQLEEKVGLLESELELNKNLTEEIGKLNIGIEELNAEIKELQTKLKDGEKHKKQAEKLIVKESKLEALIYENLLFDNKSIDDLVKIADTEGINTNVSQVLELLRRMRSQINITTGPFILKPTYRITAPYINKNGEFNISLPYDTKYYDIMLVSDFHITEFDEKTLGAIDRLNEYCVINKINLILNLGDFFEGIGVRKLDYESAKKNYQLVQDGIKMIPKIEGLYHAILGGNHDRNVTNYGFDPIKLLTSGREDMIEIGYMHSNVAIKNPEITLGEFGIHHPESFDFPIELDENGIESEKVVEYLKKIYARNNRDLDKSYIDIFGHTHKSQFNYGSEYCFIPAFMNCFSRKGAMHLRVYFDVDKGIKEMVFMPLDYSGTFGKNNEIVWQKQIKK